MLSWKESVAPGAAELALLTPGGGVVAAGWTRDLGPKGQCEVWEEIGKWPKPLVRRAQSRAHVLGLRHLVLSEWFPCGWGWTL